MRRKLEFRDRDGEADPLLAQAKPIRLAQVDRISAHSTNTSVTPAAHVGRNVSAPALTSKREPDYSADALTVKLQGSVLFRMTIGTDGMAHDLQLIKSLGFGLDERAAEALSQWQFTPGKKDGVPVPVEATVEVNFRLM